MTEERPVKVKPHFVVHGYGLRTWIDLCHVLAVSEPEECGIEEKRFWVTLMFLDDPLCFSGDGKEMDEEFKRLFQAWTND